MNWHETRQFISPCFPEVIQTELDMLLPGELQEIRLRTGKPTVFITSTRTVSLPWRPEKQQLEALVEGLSEHSLYARSDETGQGFLTLRGGHRLGLCGHIAQSDLRSVLSDIGSVCIRIAGQWPGAADALMPHVSTLTKGILIIGPPGSGKTTILRDFARQLCIRQPALQLSIVDERGELAACVGGVPQLDIGNCSDVLDGLPKARAIPWLVRSMHPHWIITDELLGQSDAEAVLEAASCGIAVCASAHGGSLSDAAARPSLAGLMAQRAFDLYAVLSADDAGRTISLHDRTGNPLPL